MGWGWLGTGAETCKWYGLGLGRYWGRGMGWVGTGAETCKWVGKLFALFFLPCDYLNDKKFKLLRR